MTDIKMMKLAIHCEDDSFYIEIKATINKTKDRIYEIVERVTEKGISGNYGLKIYFCKQMAAHLKPNKDGKLIIDKKSFDKALVNDMGNEDDVEVIFICAGCNRN